MKKRKQLLHCPECGKKKKIKYSDTLYFAHMNCSGCGRYIGFIEFQKGRSNPYYHWPIPAGHIPKPEVIEELGL